MNLTSEIADMEPLQAKTNNSGSERWSDLPTRIVSALVILPISLACIWAGGEVFLIFLTVLSLFCSYEWCRISGLGVSFRSTIVFWIGILISFAAFHNEIGNLSYLVVVGSVLLTYLISIRRGRNNAVLASLGIPYLVLAFLTCFILRDSYQGVWHLAWLVAMVVATDIGAYMSGRTFGGPKIAPRISPKKTWAGLFGGITASILVTFYFISINVTFDHLVLTLLIAAIIPVVAQAGDFLESWMKRRANVKDSSRLIPGHGGFLDRLDGFLAALPVFALYKYFI